jgi:hypothetical protein
MMVLSSHTGNRPHHNIPLSFVLLGVLLVVTTTTTTTTTTSSNFSVVEAFQSTVFPSLPSSSYACHARQYNNNYNYNCNNKCGRIRRKQQQKEQQNLFSLPTRISTTTSNQRSQSQLFALVYGTDGKAVKDENQFGYSKIDDDIGGDDNDDIDIDDHSFLLESLRNYDSNNIFWTKIACAFAPPPHDRLAPGLVKEATLMKVGKSNFDIAVAVPVNGGQQLVQILVTVGFPQAIDIEGMINPEDKLSALIQQVHVLEGHAKDRLASSQKQQQVGFNNEHYYERIVIEKNWLERLQKEPTETETETDNNDDNDDNDGTESKSQSQSQVYPDWWTKIELPKSSLELVDECKSLKSLVNEDEFEDELRALFVQNYNDDDHTIDNILVLRAAVSSIGSSGMYLQARVFIKNENENNNEVILAAAVPFESNTALRKEFHTIDDVREGVLTLVESVAPMPKPALPPLSLSSGSTTIVDSTTADTTSTTETTFTPFNEQVMKSVNTAAAANTTATVKLVEDDDKTDNSTIPIQTSSSDEEDDDERPQGLAAIATDTIAKNITATVATTKAEGDVEEDKEAVTSTTLESADTIAKNITATVATTKAEGDVEEDKEEVTSTTLESSSSASPVNDTDNAQSRQQPKSPEEEAKLAAKYGAIEDLGERAYTILRDLNMV